MRIHNNVEYILLQFYYKNMREFMNFVDIKVNNSVDFLVTHRLWL